MILEVGVCLLVFQHVIFIVEPFKDECEKMFNKGYEEVCNLYDEVVEGSTAKNIEVKW
jgi:hypothetical protein